MASTCRGCGQEILWFTTLAGKAMPVDPEPAPTGNVDLVWVGGDEIAVVLSKEDALSAQAAGHKLYLSHFTSCPQAGRFRR